MRHYAVVNLIVRYAQSANKRVGIFFESCVSIAPASLFDQRKVCAMGMGRERTMFFLRKRVSCAQRDNACLLYTSPSPRD